MTGWCVEAHDLAASQLVAFRDKDRSFVRVLLTERLISARTLKLRIRRLPSRSQVTLALTTAILQWLDDVVKDIER
jgi:hypothetical protein